MERSRNLWVRLCEADVVDWAFAALFFTLGMLAATLMFIVWG